MYKNGYVKILMATPPISIGNPLLNVEPILNILDQTDAQVSLFPELCITGYSAADLFFQKDFIDKSLLALQEIINSTTNHKTFILGLPLLIDDSLYNVAVVVNDKKIIGVIPKYHLPNYKEFSEKRWFNSGSLLTLTSIKILGQKVPFGKMVFKNDLFKFGVEICQDMWMLESPGDTLIKNGAHIIFNLSASSEYVGKSEQRKLAVIDASRRQKSAYIYTSSGPSEAVIDVVFSPHKIAASLGLLVDESNIIDNSPTLTVDVDVENIKYSRRIDSNWKELNHFDAQDGVALIDFKLQEVKEFVFTKKPNTLPFIPTTNLNEQLNIATHIQVEALISKLKNFTNPKLLIGVSGGLDSTLALLVAHKAFLKMKVSLKNIIAVTMPTANTSDRSKVDALALMKILGVKALEIPIDDMLKQHLKDIKHQDYDVTYENAQARIRTLVLMDLANKHQGLVLGTGDLSEIALGWMTFNGDHMSMYCINAGIPKTFVKELVNYHSHHEYQSAHLILQSILEAPISPELLKNQETEKIIGKYCLNDFILYHHMVNGADEDKCAWLLGISFDLEHQKAKTITKQFFDRFYAQQFKRQVMPEGPKVLNISLSPRGEMRLPSDTKR